jgi:hypothetical protein
MPNPAPMHKYLTGFDRYNTELPFIVEKPFTDDQIARLRDVIETNRQRNPEYRQVPSPTGQEQYNGTHQFDPKKIVHMSRLLIEFECPADIVETMDAVCKPIHKDPIQLVHYNYIDYNLKHGEGKNAPSLPPHLDADENLVTFNYCLDQNIEDWEVWVEDKPYTLKKGDAIIFSAVNQVHWRPKRKWKEGEFVEIVSFDYCPPTNWRLTGHDNPIDPFLFPEKREEYTMSLSQHPAFQTAWRIYNDMGREIGIHDQDLAGFAE